MAGKRTSRDEWQKRVERWNDSRPTAKEFAAETGVNVGTLQCWTYKLVRLGSERWRRPGGPASIVSSIVEVRSAAEAVESRFEIELKNGRRLRVPAIFDAGALKTMLAVLEATT